MSQHSLSSSMKLLLSVKTYLVILVLLLVAGPTVHFFLGYHSVNGTIVELVKAHRSTAPSSAAFYVEAHVWSWAGSLLTRVGNLTFNLAVDGFPFGTVTVPGGSFQPRQYLTYNLKFQTGDDTAARVVSESDSNNIVITMIGLVNAGFYGQLITRSDSAMWKWTT